jgi:phage terminase large subunit-like protein
LVGITTAGDENSELLTRLYANAEKGIAGDLDRFGSWIWEASDAVVPDDDDELLGLLMEANPALQSGRIDPKLLLDDVRALPTDDIVRYRLNRFIQSGKKTFIPAELWQKCERSFDQTMPNGDVVFAIDRTPDWEHATIAAAVKVDDVIYTELVASINKPTLEQLLYICGQLMSHSPRSIIVDGYTLRDLYKELKTRGYPAETATLGDIVNASSMFYARLARRTLQHAGDPLLSIQVPRTVRKMIGEGFRVSRRDSAVEIDAVMATLLATFGADTLREQTLQVF